MREILFRGKRKDNGEWVEGYLYIKYFPEFPHDRYVIQYETKCDSKEWKPKYMIAEVIPESISEFTGLTDKKGKKIFEGDIVDVEYDVQYSGVARERIGVFQVEFDRGCFMKRKAVKGGLYHFILSDVCKIIGNIYDNPELMNKE